MMKVSNQQNINLSDSHSTPVISDDKNHRDELRFWQTISLSLALFAFGLIASLVISLIVMLMAR